MVHLLPQGLPTRMLGEAHLAYVGLGANLGDTRVALAAAFVELQQLPGTSDHRCSSWFRSAPVDATGPDYLNAVACFSTSMSPQAVLIELQRIELFYGRERRWRNAPRTLDLDLLLHGQAILSDPVLTLPHPRLHERAFVLLPLAELDSELFIPGRGLVSELLTAVSTQRIERLA
jgi:2-amino-4-hydroxy-6-hydroxymethyldihydropteridine diphosphokinase